MTNTTNAPATPFNFEEKFPTLDAAQAATKLADLANYRITKVTEGEWIVLDMKGKQAEPKAASKAASKGKGAKAAKGGRKSVEARQAGQKADAAKAKAAAKEKGEKRDFIANPGWAKLSERRWLGKWADFEAAAKQGRLPDAMGAKAENTQLFGGIFAAATHRPFDKKIAALAALIRAKDEKGLKAIQVKEISTTPIMLGKLRDLAIAALQAKADKPAKPAKANGKAKAATPPNGAAEPAQAPTS